MLPALSMLRVQEVHVEECVGAARPVHAESTRSTCRGVCAGAARPVHGHALPTHLLLNEEQSFLIE